MNRKRLQRLVDIKRRLRDAQTTAVAAAGACLDTAEQQVVQERQQLIEQAAQLAALRTLQAPELAMVAQLVEAAGVRVQNATAARDRAEAAYEQVRQELVEATHDMQRVEKLHERAQKAHATDQRRREQRDLDEVAARMGGRP